MTNFEEEAMNEFAKSEYVYMAYDGTFRGKTDGTVIEFVKGTTIYTFPWLEFAKNWHSDEEFQELLDKYSNLNDNYEKEVIKSSKMESQIIGLKEPKAILNINITSEELAQKIVKELNKNKEHKCTPECFGKHVIKAIQKDYDSCSKESKPYFLMYWYDNLSKYFPWLEKLYIIDDKIYFKSKESSI